LDDYVVISETNLPAEAKRRSAVELAGQIAEDASPEEKEAIQKAVAGMPDEAFAPKTSPLEQVLNAPPASLAGEL
jgi:hypothetical protein